ncbi:invasion protein [Salmonella enterica]|uniref:Invasion protein n=1 Tax=Salmonella enterica TaxID=28901 RepID=A0A722ZM03_SALER|nr:invasion protein [Salmonella enterica]EBJ5519384.1 invasion protein [Salmonella enterica]EFX6534456.1 invasion protein [Shigella sonnei]HAD9392967.1 invasion protein [Salmonella enterica]
MTWELILDGYSESSYSATPRFAAARLPWFTYRKLKNQSIPLSTPYAT